MTFTDMISKSTRTRGLEPFNVSGFFTTADQDNVMRGGNIFGSVNNGFVYSDKVGASLNDLYETIRTTPELVGILKVIIEDTMSDGWKFEGFKNAVKTAEEFQDESQYYKKLSEMLWDLLLTGDAIAIKLLVSEDELTQIINSTVEGQSIELKKQAIETAQHFSQRPMEIQVLRRDTITFIEDKEGTGKIIAYEQRVGGKRILFDPQDIIHLTLNNIGGSITGFTPAHTLLTDIETLKKAKLFARKVFENDGNPTIMYNLPDVQSEDDRAFINLVDQLRQLKNGKNQLRSLVTFGNVQLKEINNLGKDFELRNQILHLTTLLMLAWGIPSHRVPLLQQKTTNFPKESNDGYFKSINHLQNILSTQLNKQLWDDFKVKMKFNKAFQIDELREATIATMLLDRNVISVTEAREMMGLSKEAPSDLNPIAQIANRTQPSRSPNPEQSLLPPRLQDNRLHAQ